MKTDVSFVAPSRDMKINEPNQSEFLSLLSRVTAEETIPSERRFSAIILSKPLFARKLKGERRQRSAKVGRHLREQNLASQ